MRQGPIRNSLCTSCTRHIGSDRECAYCGARSPVGPLLFAGRCVAIVTSIGGLILLLSL